VQKFCAEPSSLLGAWGEKKRTRALSGQARYSVECIFHLCSLLNFFLSSHLELRQTGVFMLLSK